MIDIISLHIPKTAGRSFLAILNHVYGNNSVAHFDKKSFPDKNIPEIVQFKSIINDATKVIHGHFYYKDIADLKNKSDTKIITWVRDPVERVISNFSFFKKRISMTPNDLELQQRKHETLMEYASLDGSRDRMSKFMDGLDPESYFFIGITEYFSTDILFLAKLLDWDKFPIEHINTNAEFKSLLPAISETDRKQIALLNKIDMELYKKSVELRKQRII